MIEKKDYAPVRHRLQECLEQRFADISVEIGDDIHYPGTNIVATSRDFEGLLAEQRFHHVVRAVPQELYEEYLKRGVVWFELAPGETGRDLMKMPRASDVADEEDAIRTQLVETRFFPRFQEALADDSRRASITRFELTRDVSAKGGLNEEEVTRVCLFMILQGAYCDAHVLTDVLPMFVTDSPA